MLLNIYIGDENRSQPLDQTRNSERDVAVENRAILLYLLLWGSIPLILCFFLLFCFTNCSTSPFLVAFSLRKIYFFSLAFSSV